MFLCHICLCVCLLFILICSADIVCAVQNITNCTCDFLTRAVNKEHVGIIVIDKTTRTMFNMRENYDFS